MKRFVIELSPESHTIFILAPTPIEAIRQAYVWIESRSYNGDVVDYEELTHAEREFLDTETGEVITEDDLYAEYRANEISAEITFAEYITNCCAKNGTLKRIWRN